MLSTISYFLSEEPTKTPALAPLHDEDGVMEVTAVCYATFSKSDYGVPGSPVFYEVDEVDVHEYEINGITYSAGDLAKKFGKETEETLAEIMIEVAMEKGDWDE